ncbi:unnamed protein product [Angiostrongylus costaricensis]|uniref:Uncharacterized protein n=1 Tax=Angiostrongylus costaricensis TaxID=334426 RepID=A0A0R3PWP6_ANGCS|nr:unnamed protein product [Angiostrongylus costaricensis]
MVVQLFTTFNDYAHNSVDDVDSGFHYFAMRLNIMKNLRVCHINIVSNLFCLTICSVFVDDPLNTVLMDGNRRKPAFAADDVEHTEAMRIPF